jgi:hypothetical protein
MLDGFSANEIVRTVESAFTSYPGGPFPTTGDGDVLTSVAVTAPHAGFVLATGAANIGLSQFTQGRCGLDLDTPDGSTGWVTFATSSIVTNTAPPATGIQGAWTCSATRVFPVSAGQHTVRLKGRLEAGTVGNAAVNGGQLTAAFIPFGPGG